MTKSDLVILDANIVIDAHREGYINPLVNGHQIHLPRTVVQDEAHFFADGVEKKSIRLTPLIQAGKIKVIEADIEDEKRLHSLVKSIYLSAFDPGEREALALLTNPQYKNFLFCTADRAAIKGLSILGMSQRGVSAEKLLVKIGDSRKLKRNFTEDWFKKALQEGVDEKHLWRVS